MGSTSRPSSIFSTAHLGRLPDLAALGDLAAADFRAALAARMADGLKHSSSARFMSVVRGFFRFLDRRGFVHNAALAAVRTPKRAAHVPKALSEEDAAETLATAPTLARTHLAAEARPRAPDAALWLRPAGSARRLA